MPAAFCSSLTALAAAEPATQPISVQTALLIILGIGLLLAAKSLADLHRRVDALASSARPKSPRAAPSVAGTLPPEVMAVIAAAVFATLGSDHQIVSISTDQQDSPSWSHEGRRQVFAGRKVR